MTGVPNFVEAQVGWLWTTRAGSSTMSDKATLADVARSLFAEPTVVGTLQRIVDLAAETVDGCDGAGLLLVGKREIVAGAWSNELARKIEVMEYEIGEGPCLDAIWEVSRFESSDLREQSSLWPTFAARAIEAGVESMLAFRLFVSDETLGALDLYGSRRGAFGEAARAFGTVFAATRRWHSLASRSTNTILKSQMACVRRCSPAMSSDRRRGSLWSNDALTLTARSIYSHVVPRSECEVASGCRARRRHRDSSRTMI